MSRPALAAGFTSQAQIDAQYDPGAVVGKAGEGAYLAGYVERSRAARERLACTLDVAYGPTLDETLDVFPAAAADAPVFVFLHGGYWRALSAKEFSCLASGPVARGITTVIVNYSLCPKVTIDEIVRQSRAAVAWTLRHIAGPGGDPTRVAVGGHSAGGHLSAMCLETRWADDYGFARDPIAAAVLVSGIFDIAPLRHSYLQPVIRLDDGIVERNSPLFRVRECATDVLVTWGEEESGEFARQSRAFHAAWQGAGNRGELLPQPGANHYSAIDPFEDGESVVCGWLADRLGAGR